MTEPSRDPFNVDGRTFVDATPDPMGDVSADTTFEYHEEHDGIIWARYSGGSVKLGHLTGRRDGPRLDFRYAHIDDAGNTASGHCIAQLDLLADHRLRSNESWTWDSKPGDGTSVVEERPG